MKHARILNAILIVVLIYALGAFSSPLVAVADTAVSISVSTQVAPGDNFTAKIDIESVTDFDAAQYDITYNSAVIQVTGVTSGNISGTAIPVSPWGWGYIPASTQGTIRVINNVPETPGVTGSGYLAEIYFHVVGAAGTSSAISLSNGILGDKNAEEITPVTWTGDTVQVGTSGTSGGGGGGGGGGPSGTTSLAEYMTSDGLIVTNATAESVDGKVKLLIPKGTIVKNRNGQRLYSVSIKEDATPPTPPADCKFVCLTYDIGPSGATFNPPIYLTFKYSDLQVPAGVTEENMVLATWQDGKWVELEGCVVDAVNNTITVPISHFTAFTVMAPTTPASFEVTRMTVTPAEVYTDETVTVSATITNTGDLTGSYDLTLKINDLVLQTRKVTLSGGQSDIISFTVTPDTTGEYTVDVNGLSNKFKVKEPVPEGTVAEVSVPTPASFTISDLSVTPREVNPSEEVTISAVVTNIGGSDGSYTVVLKIDEAEEASQRVTIEADKSKTITFTTTKDIEGNYTVDINGNVGGFVVVVPQPTLPQPTEGLPVEPSTSWPLYIGVAAGGVIIIGLFFFITLRRRHSYRTPGR